MNNLILIILILVLAKTVCFAQNTRTTLLNDSSYYVEIQSRKPAIKLEGKYWLIGKKDIVLIKVLTSEKVVPEIWANAHGLYEPRALAIPYSTAFQDTVFYWFRLKDLCLYPQLNIGRRESSRFFIRFPIRWKMIEQLDKVLFLKTRSPIIIHH